jgi:hypothetical protein
MPSMRALLSSSPGARRRSLATLVVAVGSAASAIFAAPAVPAVLAVLPVLSAVACHSAGSAQLRTMTVDEVDARIAARDGKTFVFDDNPHDRFVKGHLPGAKWLSTPEPTQADLPADHGALLVFYCASEL